MKNCIECGSEFHFDQLEKEFLVKMAIKVGAKQYIFPEPDKCPTCRLRRRLSFRNQRKLYRRSDGLISTYSDDKPYKVISKEQWWSDDHDAREYGRDYDFNRPFFDQFAELMLACPRLSLLNTNAENSDFCNFTLGNKNCYMVFGGDFNEDCFYSTFNMHCRDIAECYWANKNELCYECIDCIDCYRLKFSQDCSNCRDSWFLYDCKSCSDCIGCVGLVNKKFHIFNEPYSEEDYRKKLQEFNFASQKSIQDFISKFHAFKVDKPHRPFYQLNCENCIGDRVVRSRNCFYCYDVDGAEDMLHVVLAGWEAKDAQHSNHFGHKSYFAYESLSSANSYFTAFCVFAWHCNNIIYSDNVLNSSNLFGCCNLKKAEYCILNKQYTKEEYEALLPKIIEHMQQTGEWGQFFPYKLSPYGYNETIAHDYYPLSQEQAAQLEMKWKSEPADNQPQSQQLISPPDTIAETPDSIVTQNFGCKKCQKPFKIIKEELKFYKKLNLPLPVYCFDCRFLSQFRKRNPNQLWQRNCPQCYNSFLTSYSPGRPETVYCETCYLKSAY